MHTDSFSQVVRGVEFLTTDEHGLAGRKDTHLDNKNALVAIAARAERRALPTYGLKVMAL
jgi:hypothetical protein